MRRANGSGLVGEVAPVSRGHLNLAPNQITENQLHDQK